MRVQLAKNFIYIATGSYRREGGGGDLRLGMGELKKGLSRGWMRTEFIWKQFSSPGEGWDVDKGAL